MQGTIPALPYVSKGDSSSGRRSLLLHNDDNDTLLERVQQEDALSEDAGSATIGSAHLLDDAASGYAAMRRAALAPMQSSLSQLRHLTAEIRSSGVGMTGRSLLQSSTACGDLGDLSQTPNSTSTISPSSPPDLACNLGAITAETILMANILGAVASTASAITAMQVGVMFFSGWESL